MLIRYVGPFPAVVIAATGQLAVRDQVLDVDDTVAVALCRQRVWVSRDGALVVDIPAKVGAIVEWIGDDPQRAQKALDLEQAKAKPRPGVISAARAVLDALASASDAAGDAAGITAEPDPDPIAPDGAPVDPEEA
ncbi:MAG: hypothetical protein ACXIVQ_12245 [Acidimicrobiales bacterium]